MTEYAVKVDHVSKIYQLKNKDGSHATKQFYALQDLSFQINQGDVVGILGTNGSGKSTLSLILAGISDIDEGSLDIRGEQALIAINTGLNPQLTGEENIKVKGALLGLKKKEIEQITQSVIDFAEHGNLAVCGAVVSGKSTFLSLITGKLVPESGSVSVSGSIGFCSQLYTPLTEDDFQYLYDYSGEMWEYRRLLAISEEMFFREETLSGGEKKRLQLFSVTHNRDYNRMAYIIKALGLSL